jgi:hypothetical protein
MAETPGTGNAFFMVDPARLNLFNCVERGKVSAKVIIPRLVGHAITYGNVACD